MKNLCSSIAISSLWQTSQVVEDGMKQESIFTKGEEDFIQSEDPLQLSLNLWTLWMPLNTRMTQSIVRPPLLSQTEGKRERRIFSVTGLTVERLLKEGACWTITGRRTLRKGHSSAVNQGVIGPSTRRGTLPDTKLFTLVPSHSSWNHKSRE